jgi:tetratricopeptide (TPR) repeat protein
MRYGDRKGCAALLAAAVALAGCASADVSVEALKRAMLKVAPIGVAAAPDAEAAPEAAPEAMTAAAEPAAAPVDPAVQRAYDEALRALREGRAAQAERGFRALAASHPELGGPHANLGLLMRQAGKLDDAVAALEKAVRASPRQPVYFNELGIAYRMQGRFAQAREAYEQAIALDPNYAAAQLNLGILHDLYLGDGAHALALYDRYLALSPGGDATVSKWVADLRRRKPTPVALNQKDKP